MGPGNKFFTLGVDLLKAGLLMLFLLGNTGVVFFLPK